MAAARSGFRGVLGVCSWTEAQGEIRIDRQRCVDCGICTSVCPSGALSSRDLSLLAAQLRMPALSGLWSSAIPSCPSTPIALVVWGSE